MTSAPYGMILTCGPTGAGKTTSLYAALNMINTVERNIITIEDPVEYQLPGVIQGNVNRKAGLTFASGLRTIVRQDPDVILVGEIRDSGDRRGRGRGGADGPPRPQHAARQRFRRRRRATDRHAGRAVSGGIVDCRSALTEADPNGLSAMRGAVRARRRRSCGSFNFP